MPLQNRVTPFGEIIATPARGMFTGNRGIIHDPETRSLLRKRWSLKTWLICQLRYKDLQRTPMAGRSWTELFFLDEATALAAGHRPCFFCSRDRAEAFRRFWAAGNRCAVPRAAEMDAVLHRERLDGSRKRIHALGRPIAGLPDGAMIAAGQNTFVVLAGRPRRWTPSGYERGGDVPSAAGLLTPPSTLATLKSGYRPVLHPTAEDA